MTIFGTANPNVINNRQKQLAQRLIMKQQAAASNHRGGRFLPPGHFGAGGGAGVPFRGMGSAIKGHFTPGHTARGGISQRIIDAMGIGGRGYAGRDYEGPGQQGDIRPSGVPSPGGAGGGYMPPPQIAPDAPGGSVGPQVQYPGAPTPTYDPNAILGQYPTNGGQPNYDPNAFAGPGAQPAPTIDPALLYWLQQQGFGGGGNTGGGGGTHPGLQM